MGRRCPQACSVAALLSPSGNVPRSFASPSPAEATAANPSSWWCVEPASSTRVPGRVAGEAGRP